MPEVIQIRPKGIYVNIEISLDELKMLRDACNMVELKVDFNDDNQVRLNDYFINRFYPFVNKIVEDIERGS